MIKRIQWFRILQLTLVFLVATSLLHQAPKVSAIASQASLETNVSVYLYNKQLMPSDEGQVALVTLMIDNQSSNEVELLDYWARIRGKNNTYVTKLSHQDENKKLVLPGNKAYITYYANISTAEELSDISVDVIKWDFAKNNYESVVGNLSISEVNQPNINEEVPIRIGDIQLKAVLEDQFIYEDLDNKVISYRIKLTNDINKVADVSSFMSYAVINKTEVHEAISVVSESSINGKSSVYLYGQVNVPKDVALDAMSIALVDKKEQEMYPLLVFPVYTLSERELESIDKEININAAGNVYSIKGEEVTVSPETNRAVVDLKFNIKNKSKHSGDLKSILFYVKTDSGLIYQLDYIDTELPTLLPEIEETFRIRGNVPSEQSLVGGQLLIGYKVGDSEVILKNLVLGKIDIEENEDTSVLIVNGQEVNFSRLSRVPNEQNDLVVAEFEVKNVSKDSKKPLELSGNFIIDDVEIDSKETKILRMNNNLTILPNESERFVAYINVPFTQVISKYAFNLTVDEKNKKKIDMTVENSSRLLAKNEKYQLKSIGKRADVIFSGSSLYTGSKDDLFVVELQIKNTEKRNVVPSAFNGYIQTLTGEVYQLNFETFKQSIMPNGNIITVGSTTIPKSTSLSQLTMHIGEQLETEEVIYIDPVYIVYEPVDTRKDNLIDMVNVSDKKFWVWNTKKEWLASNGTDVDGFEILLNYQIDDQTNGIRKLGDRNIIVEYIDITMPLIKMTQKISLADELIDQHQGTLRLSYTNPDIPYGSLDSYVINVYEEYKGYKKVVMTQNFKHQ